MHCCLVSRLSQPDSTSLTTCTAATGTTQGTRNRQCSNEQQQGYHSIHYDWLVKADDLIGSTSKAMHNLHAHTWLVVLDSSAPCADPVIMSAGQMLIIISAMSQMTYIFRGFITLVS
jgi:hypothetical protein